MSLTSTLTLDNAAGADRTFVYLGGDNNGSRRLDSATTNAEPCNLIIKNTVSGSGANAVDRHLVQFSQTKLDVESVPRTAIVNFTIAAPRSTAITDAMIKDLVANLVSLITDRSFSQTTGFGGTTVLTSLLRGES